MEYRRFENETEEELIYRVCSQKDAIGTWNDVAEILNELLNYEYTESRYRKVWQGYQKIFVANQSKFTSEEAMLEEIKEQRREFEKEKIKFRDERNEYNKLIRETARKESFIDLVKRQMEQTIEPFNFEEKEIAISDNAMIIHITDIHTGIHIDNFLNKFNTEILKERLNKYLNEIFRIQKTHNASEATIVLGGDCISGLIHPNLRLENNENVISQLKIISNCLGEFIDCLEKKFSRIDIYSVSGNHSRLCPNKEEQLKGEELDALIPYNLGLMFRFNDRINVCDNSIDDTIVSFKLRNHLWYAVHGHLDRVSSVVPDLTLMTGVKPDGILMGHRHTNGLTTISNTKVVESGCVSGNDNFCIERRLSGTPEQCVIITNNEKVIDCLYDIQLN